MSVVCVFAGTAEGRLAAEYLAGGGVETAAHVATEYGGIVLPEREGLAVYTGRLSEAEMEALFAAGELVIDATHPYAQEVSRNLRAACARAGAEYIRLLRPSSEGAASVTVGSAAEAAAYLNAAEGKVLLTTGSKELSAFAAVKDGPERLYARVLPTAEALAACESIGLRGQHVIAMQGPFSRELNAALLRQLDARFLVTKESGGAGGFPEKLAAAAETGARVVLIARPGAEAGMDLETLKSWLAERLGIGRAENRYFPMFVDLKGKPVLVVGGGAVAARRAAALRQYGAEVTVVAPEVCAEVRTMAESGGVRLCRRAYRPEDMEGMTLAVAATDVRAVNEQAGRDAKRLGLPVSVADARGEGSFLFPAVFEGGGVSGGLISLEGRDHKLVRRTAEKIRRIL